MNDHKPNVPLWPKELNKIYKNSNKQRKEFKNIATYGSHWLSNWTIQYTLRIGTHAECKHHIQAYLDMSDA